MAGLQLVRSPVASQKELDNSFCDLAVQDLLYLFLTYQFSLDQCCAKLNAGPALLLKHSFEILVLYETSF